ncbi:MAG TPA: helix-turn-helix domain-containing protein [Patescibacteria group bacterium]|nr:helix-turn-helix domain-containing protein [Patescibacteria group bacterium]
MIRVGQKLQEERQRRKISLDEVSAATKIKVSFLQALEKGEYQHLPSPTYAQGFIRNYAEYLGLPKKEIFALFRREYDSEKHVRVLPDTLLQNRRVSLRQFRIQRRIILLTAVCLLVFGYIAYQYRFMVLNPSLSLISPKEEQRVRNTVTVSGKTNATASVSVNDEEVVVTSTGNFIKKLTVFPGENTIIIRVTNRFGKETVLERTVIAE